MPTEEVKCEISDEEHMCSSEPSLNLNTQLMTSDVMRVSDKRGVMLTVENVAEETVPQ